MNLVSEISNELAIAILVEKRLGHEAKRVDLLDLISEVNRELLKERSESSISPSKSTHSTHSS